MKVKYRPFPRTTHTRWIIYEYWFSNINLSAHYWFVVFFENKYEGTFLIFGHIILLRYQAFVTSGTINIESPGGLTRQPGRVMVPALISSQNFTLFLEQWNDVTLRTSVSGQTAVEHEQSGQKNKHKEKVREKAMNSSGVVLQSSNKFIKNKKQGALEHWRHSRFS